MGRRVLVVDDHAGFRQEAKHALQDAGFEFVDEAPDGAAGLRAAAGPSPDLVLLDIALPDVSGIDLVEPIRALAPRARIVLISSRRRAEFGDRIERSTADTFVDKIALGTANGQRLKELLEG
jgi:two-component system nitrate/nitrite response regulator NarL/two-component system nitrate/nitrite response regulator NarP